MQRRKDYDETCMQLWPHAQVNLKWFLCAHPGWRATQPAGSDGESDNRKEPGSRRCCGGMPVQGKGTRNTIALSPDRLPLHFLDRIHDFEPCEEKQEKAWYHSYIIKPWGEHDLDAHWLGFSNVLTCKKLLTESGKKQLDYALPVHINTAQKTAICVNWMVMQW